MRTIYLHLLISILLLLPVLSCSDLIDVMHEQTFLSSEAPSDLEADALTSASIKLTWTDNSTSEDGFDLQRSLLSDFSITEYIDLVSDSVSYVDKALDTDNTYYYRIQAYDGTLLSEWSNIAEVDLSDTPGNLTAPSNLVAVLSDSTTSELTWTDNSDNETSFVIHRSESSGFTTFSTISVLEDSVSHTDSGLVEGNAYYYRIAAVNSEGTSSFSNTASVSAINDTVVQVSFTDGTEWSGYEKVYTIWVANEAESFYQNIYVCNRIKLQNLASLGLPYWQENFRSFFTSTEIDDISGATISTGDFQESIILEDNNIREFTVYFEVDHSFDGNDWFSDQPAVLYKVDVDLEDNISSYTMDFIGWTPNENTNGGIPGGVFGVLNTVLGYIINLNDGLGGFGALEPEPATDLVGGLTVEINP